MEFPRNQLYDSTDIIAVSLYGDGTVEFVLTDGESLNWGEFDIDIIKQVINNLK